METEIYNSEHAVFLIVIGKIMLATDCSYNDILRDGLYFDIIRMGMQDNGIEGTRAAEIIEFMRSYEGPVVQL